MYWQQCIQINDSRAGFISVLQNPAYRLVVDFFYFFDGDRHAIRSNLFRRKIGKGFPLLSLSQSRNYFSWMSEI
jgi:hypothetical protein